jgi:dipeptidyl aminopeptidase/acylaminoacyl peptidase
MDRSLWLIDADGAEARQLTTDPGYRDERPLWSADGSHLLFARLDAEDRASLWLTSVEGGEPQQVVEELTPAPEWFGTYGHIDWAQHFDWWRGDVRSATTTEQPSPPPPATPTREITLAAPEAGATVANPVEVRGRVSVMPFEANLRGRVYDAQGQVVGEAPIQAQPDTEGDLGGPGTFAGTIPFQVETSGPGRVEIAEISARDGSVVVSATAAVTLTTDATSALDR